MIEVADVFRRFAADYLSAHGTSMLPSHRRAIEDILDCRTAALGGQVWHCEACNTEVFLRIPTHRGHLLRFDRGQATDLMAATIPI